MMVGAMRSLLCAFLLSASHANAETVRTPVSAVPLSRMDTPWWRARHLEKMALLRAGPVDLVWLGDSITQNWEASGPPDWMDFTPVWRRYYGDRHPLNLGFKGDTTQHLLWRMTNGELAGITPRAAVVLIGANNMGRVRNTAAQVVAGIEAVIDTLRTRLPSTRVVLVSVLPSIRSAYVTRTTERVNAELARRYASMPGVTFVDATDLFIAHNAVDRAAFYDDQLSPPDPPLHPTPAAMARLAARIEPLVAAAMGDGRH